MTLAAEIVTAEGRIKAARLTVDEFCALVPVARATWQRWKAGKTEPSVTVWRKVEAELAKLSSAGGSSGAAAERPEAA